MAHDVFISYSTEDKATADAICARLEANGVRCWIAPRDVLPGDDYAEALVEAIGRGRLMVLVFSSNSNKSPHVMREVERASTKGIVILPFRIEDVPPSKSMEYFISRTHWLDALTPPLEKHLERLAETVNRLLARTETAEQAGGELEATVSAPAVREAIDRGREKAPAARKAFESVKWWAGRPIAVLALGIGAAGVVTIIVLVALLSGGGDGDSGSAALVPSPTEGGETVASGTPTVTPSTPTTTQDPAAAGPAPPMGEADEYAILASPECVALGGRLEATWTAVERQGSDLIALLSATARNDEYAQYKWNYFSTVGGRVIYPAPSTPGEYEFRLLRAGSHLAVSNSITVQDGCPASAVTAELEGYSAIASPDCVGPDGRVEATWTAVDRQGSDLIALLSATARNDEYSDYEWNYVSTTGGSVIYPAPSISGEYEVRLIRDGTHLAVSQPITVSETC